MLVHSNPMIEHKNGVWEDTHLGRVMVKSFMVNWGNHRKRWGVFVRVRRGGAARLESKHITEAQAVVLAQRLANRLYRQTKEKNRGSTQSRGNARASASNPRASRERNEGLSGLLH